MRFRDTGLSLVITVAVLLALGVIAAIHRVQTGEKPVVQTPMSSPPVAADASAPRLVKPLDFNAPAVVSSAGAAPVVPVVLAPRPIPEAEWDVLTDCELAQNRTNSAHHFHVRRDSETYVFQLYYSVAPEVTAPRPDQIGQQAGYFRLPLNRSEAELEKDIMALGNLAWHQVEQWLATGPFRVFTKWEKMPDTLRYYGFVQVQDEAGKWRFLQELLAEHGLACVNEPPLKSLPDGETGAEFLDKLRRLQQQAQINKRGAWGPLPR